MEIFSLDRRHFRLFQKDLTWPTADCYIRFCFSSPLLWRRTHNMTSLAKVNKPAGLDSSPWSESRRGKRFTFQSYLPMVVPPPKTGPRIKGFHQSILHGVVDDMYIKHVVHKHHTVHMLHIPQKWMALRQTFLLFPLPPLKKCCTFSEARLVSMVHGWSIAWTSGWRGLWSWPPRWRPCDLWRSSLPRRRWRRP